MEANHLRAAVFGGDMGLDRADADRIERGDRIADQVQRLPLAQPDAALRLRTGRGMRMPYQAGPVAAMRLGATVAARQGVGRLGLASGR
ncbi:hypothetical protein D3C81_1387190 [compost metagenome]